MPASSSIVTPAWSVASRATTTSPPNSAATPTPSPSGVTASDATAWRACPTGPAAAARPLFPPEDKHKVLALATTPPADVGVPTSHWSLDDLAYQILREAHYKDMSRSTLQRILAEADLKPHKSRYWLHSDDPDFEAKALDICRLYLDAPRLYQKGELVVCVDEKTSIQALERLHPTKPVRPGTPALQEFEYLRRGTRCLLASLVVPTGRVIGSVTEHRRTWDFVRHIRDVAELFPEAKRTHWVMDNLNTHYSEKLCQYRGGFRGFGTPGRRCGRGRSGGRS